MALVLKEFVSFFAFLFSHLYSHFLPGLRGLIALVWNLNCWKLLISISEHLWGFVIWWSTQTEWCQMLLLHLGGHRSVSTQTDPRWTPFPVRPLAASTLISCVSYFPKWLLKRFFSIWVCLNDLNSSFELFKLEFEFKLAVWPHLCITKSYSD